MECKTIFTGLVVATLGIGAAFAGFAAEATKVKKSQPTVYFDGLEPVCDYPSSPSIGLAIAATVALVIARSIISATTGGCCSCCIHIPNGPKFARVFIVVSWITSSTAVILFLVGVKLSTRNDVDGVIGGVYYCYTVPSGIFVSAGIIGFVSVLFGLVYYFIYALARSRAVERSGVDIELEKPSVADERKEINRELAI
ncbi:hypothetical protein QVD17_28255 [Tagetes erecta]|uniref:Uncharacterized protein n=1 Tax=Tagetes erecta TaxID=13708 RepID=A0AAD8KEQ8_TARER|nr:hypothetical protein QVD17_28255 [Tagetes erecta]